MSGPDFLLDTNIVIELLKGEPAARTLYKVNLASGHLFASQITRIELLSFPDIQPDEEQRIIAFLNRVRVLPISTSIEATAISLRKKHRLRIPDAIILATASCHGCILVSRDLSLIRKAAGIVSCLSP
ncbi:MAG: type II toxin-antitoxin system VapC family toxin [Verrucomicrobiae bacterium]|nr:type II toxin-antitoxin system VapC family toxin [Verrucomicrobiae bacterium]